MADIRDRSVIVYRDASGLWLVVRRHFFGRGGDVETILAQCATEQEADAKALRLIGIVDRERAEDERHEQAMAQRCLKMREKKICVARVKRSHGGVGQR